MMQAQTPFDVALQLSDETYPLQLSCSNPNFDNPGQLSPLFQANELPSFLHEEFNTKVINELADWLPFVARRSPKNIDALHMQLIKGRKILVAEKADLHLVWWNNIIFIKPVPPYLCNWTFWSQYLCRDANAADGGDQDAASNACYHPHNSPPDKWCPAAAATGFLRTYAYLIRHPSDFYVAVANGLLPPDVEYAAFARFITRFRNVPNSRVALRYEYGQLRLTRLNWAVRLVRPKSAGGAWHYQEMYWQTGQYLREFTTPLMFVFGSVAVVLSAMQVVVTIPDPSLVMDVSGWRTFAYASQVASVMVIFVVLLIWIALVVGIVALLLAQFLFSLKQLRSD
jgi:hypothetical protein